VFHVCQNNVSDESAKVKQEEESPQEEEVPKIEVIEYEIPPLEIKMEVNEDEKEEAEKSSVDETTSEIAFDKEEEQDLLKIEDLNEETEKSPNTPSSTHEDKIASTCHQQGGNIVINMIKSSNLQSGNSSRFLSKYVFALCDLAPIDCALNS